MRVEIVTLFPDAVQGFLDCSILKRARQTGALEAEVIDLRNFAEGPHRQADDYPYGGGPGMVLRPEPLFAALRFLVQRARVRPLVIYPTAQGERFSHRAAKELAREGHLILIAGHYKGIDQRVVERWVDREYSLGDYVLTGGELPALAIVDAVVRLIPGVLGDQGSAKDDSFEGGLLGCAHYTRPETLEGMAVPGVLLSGNPVNIAHWRYISAWLTTRQRRPELLEPQAGAN